jgi:hypothetical protein
MLILLFDFLGFLDKTFNRNSPFHLLLTIFRADYHRIWKNPALLAFPTEGEEKCQGEIPGGNHEKVNFPAGEETVCLS